MYILNKIINNLIKDKNIKYTIANTPREVLYMLHYSIGLYIRNKYLWNNNKNVQELSKHYNTNKVDEISRLIILDAYLKIHKK